MKKYLKYIIIIALLVLFDQGAKLAVTHFYTFEGDPMQVVNTIHIHPEINPETSFADLTDMVSILCMVLFSLALIYLMYAAIVIAKRRAYPGLVRTLFVLFPALFINRVLDLLIWHGTLDYICVSWLQHIEENGVADHAVCHQMFDLTDLYLTVAFLLFVVYLILFVATCIRLGRNKEQEKEFIQEFKRRVKAFFKKPIGLLGEKTDEF